MAIAFDGLPYGFFTVLRFVVCASSIYLAWLAYDHTNSWAAYVFGFIAILFNPVIPVYLNKPLWLKIDIITGLFLIISIILLRTPEEHKKSGKGWT